MKSNNLENKAEYEASLRREFEAEDGSFLYKLRCEAEWDKEAFSRLIQLMESCARAHEGREEFERWVAHGFWYLERYATQWWSEPIRPEEKAYREAACVRLSDLSYWLFFGESPYQGSVPPL